MLQILSSAFYSVIFLLVSCHEERWTFFHQCVKVLFVFFKWFLNGDVWRKFLYTINTQSAWEVTLYCGVACVLGMVKFTISAQCVSKCLLKGSRMGHSVKVSFWCVALLINTVFAFFFFFFFNFAIGKRIWCYSKTKRFQMTQGGYQVIIILPIKSKMAAAKKQCFLRFLYFTESYLRHSKFEVYKRL